jgi:type III restriction enzyme
MPDPKQQEIPLQPVERPILSSPYDEPGEHWVYNRETGQPYRQPGRRPAFYWYKTTRTGSAQQTLFQEDERDDLPLVNRLRRDVRRWRAGGYEGTTPVTKRLLRHWSRDDLPRPLFFCQREAVETIIYLTEVLESGAHIRFTPELAPEDFRRLVAGEAPSFAEALTGALMPTLVDAPNDPARPPLRRYACKMATGSGKTVVMAMLIAWSFCNRGRVPGDTRFPDAALICCPNLTIRDRLQVLRPEHPENYYEAFQLVPSPLVPELQRGRVLVTNWHRFLPESENKAFDGGTHRVVQKGPESAEAFARTRLGDLYDRGPLLVFNDEAHHAHRPPPSEEKEGEEATVWVGGLDTINDACGIRFCVDMSATPYYLSGSGHAEGTPFPWITSDFGLVDAIESGITKVPRLPTMDDTARPDPKYYALWHHITQDLASGEKLSGGKPKPEVVWSKAQDALATLASQWKQALRPFRVRHARPRARVARAHHRVRQHRHRPHLLRQDLGRAGRGGRGRGRHRARAHRLRTERLRLRPLRE